MANLTSVLVVDDQELFRDMARTMLEASGEFVVTAEATDGVEAVAAYRSAGPQLVLMDIQMARMNGLDATRMILDADPGASVILISMRADREYERIAAQIGAIAFVAKRDLAPGVLRQVLNESRTRAA